MRPVRPLRLSTEQKTPCLLYCTFRSIPRFDSVQLHCNTYFSNTQSKMKPSQINVLIACEESQAECKAFRERGFIAYSCDVQPCKRDGNPEWHIMADVRSLLAGSCTFNTMDGKRHHVKQWHLIIAHPPCTYLCKVSSVHMMKNGILQLARYNKMLKAREFFFDCLNANAQFVAVENPLPMARAKLPPPSCFACPSWFGEKYTKKTLYWTRNLPPLMATIEYPNPKQFVRSSRGKYRSRTFAGLANALADQWGQYVINNIKKSK